MLSFGRSAHDRNKQRYDDLVRRLKDAERKQQHQQIYSRQHPGQYQEFRIYESAYQRELNYANTVILLGYGGFFALWSAAKGLVASRVFSASGFLMCISLALFVGWEIFKMYVVDRAYSEVTAKDENGLPIFTGSRSDYIDDALSSTNGKLHRWVFLISACTGIIAGLVLLVAYLVEVTSR